MAVRTPLDPSVAREPVPDPPGDGDGDGLGVADEGDDVSGEVEARRRIESLVAT
jgi:hypothetical protein